MVVATRDALVAAAMERQMAISADHKIVNEFWETYEYLEGLTNGERPMLNHSRDPHKIAINLNEFVAQAAKHGQAVPDLVDLRKHLTDSRRYKLISANTAVNSNIRNTMLGSSFTVKCWVFKKQ